MKCPSIMQFGDDAGDNCCTFHCQLEEGHKGKHKETGGLYGDIYCLEWEKEND